MLAEWWTRRGRKRGGGPRPRQRRRSARHGGNQDTEGPQAGQPYPRTVNTLRTYRKRQLEEKMRLVGLCVYSGLIFTTQSGTPVNPENPSGDHSIHSSAELTCPTYASTTSVTPAPPCSRAGTSARNWYRGTSRSRHHSHDPRHLQSLPTLYGDQAASAISNTLG